MDWTEIDELLFQGKYLAAVFHHLQSMGGRIFESERAVVERQQLLKQQFPERFPNPVSPRVTAFENLNKIEQSIVAIEAFWDGDTVNDWFNVLCAITEGSSTLNDRYTATYLSTVYEGSPALDGLDEDRNTYCRRLVDDLAAQAEAQAHHAVYPPDDEAPRWWDGAAKRT